MLVRDDLKFELSSSRIDDKGHFDATVQGSEFLFVNVYAPNKVYDQCSLSRYLTKNALETFNDYFVFLKCSLVFG